LTLTLAGDLIIEIKLSFKGDRMAQVWKIAPGERADHWEMCHERGCILIGWRALKNYRKFKSQKAILRALGGEPGDGKGAARSIWRFTNEVKPFDLVVANQGRDSVVGIGIIKSDYLSPRSLKNPGGSKWLPHARLVDWIIDQPIKLKPYFFGMPTVHALNVDKVDRIHQAYLKKYPTLKSTLINLFAGVSTDEIDDFETNDLLASAEEQLTHEGAFDPAGIEDARTRILASIVRRQGQPAFRKHLLLAYKGRCAISGCDVTAVLEAAHIVPYKGAITNHPGNGLLLRGDFHTLFDLRLIAINEATMRLLVSPKLNGTIYENYRGKKVRIPKVLTNQPNGEALEQHRTESGLK
jgi:hypothetical protein